MSSLSSPHGKARLTQLKCNPEFIAVQGSVDTLTNLKQEFGQTKIFKLNRYINKMATVQVE